MEVVRNFLANWLRKKRRESILFFSGIIGGTNYTNKHVGNGTDRYRKRINASRCKWGGFASLTKTYALDNSVLLGLVAFDPTSSTSLNVNSIRLQFERGENETLFITVSVLTTIPPRNVEITTMASLRAKRIVLFSVKFRESSAEL